MLKLDLGKAEEPENKLPTSVGSSKKAENSRKTSISNFLCNYGKGQFSFQRRAMPKNGQTTAQLHLSHMLAKICSEFSKPRFNSTCTMNFGMFKLDLEKTQEPEIKLPTSVESLKKQENSRKTSTSALLTTPKPLAL